MNPFDHQRRHPILTVTLFIAMLAPDPFLVIIAGPILKAEIPNPNALAMAVGSLVFLLLCVWHDCRRDCPVARGRAFCRAKGDRTVFRLSRCAALLGASRQDFRLGIPAAARSSAMRVSESHRLTSARTGYVSRLAVLAARASVMRTVGLREENIPALYRRAVYFVHRILKGAKPLINAGVCPHCGSLRGPVALGAHRPFNPDQRRSAPPLRVGYLGR